LGPANKGFVHWATVYDCRLIESAPACRDRHVRGPRARRRVVTANHERGLGSSALGRRSHARRAALATTDSCAVGPLRFTMRDTARILGTARAVFSVSRSSRNAATHPHRGSRPPPLCSPAADDERRFRPARSSACRTRGSRTLQQPRATIRKPCGAPRSPRREGHGCAVAGMGGGEESRNGCLIHAVTARYQGPGETRR